MRLCTPQLVLDSPPPCSDRKPIKTVHRLPTAPTTGWNVAEMELFPTKQKAQYLDAMSRGGITDT